MRSLVCSVLFLGSLGVLSGCGYYSFTGASIPTHLHDIAIPLAEDNSAGTITTLGNDLTQLLVERFVGQTRLSLQQSEEEADVLLTTRIDRYTNQPAAVSAEEQATMNRVTIYVSATYFDRVENKQVLQRTFSSFADYDPLNIDDEAEAARVALTNIADDIFSAATSNW